jgi:hypothetical protein
MKKLLVSLFVILSINSLYGQEFKWAYGAGSWVGDHAIGIKSDTDSNVYLTGYIGFGPSSGDTIFTQWGAYLAKFSSTGTLNWAVNFGTFDTYGVDVAIDPDGSVFLAGVYSHGFSFQGITLQGGLQSRIFLMKFDKDGGLLWGKDYGTISNTGVSYVNAIELDSNNNIYLGGHFKSRIKLGDSTYFVRGQEGGYSDMLLVKLSSDGEVLTVKNPGSISNEFIYDIAVNQDGIFIAGFFGRSVIEVDTLQYHSPKGNLGCIIKYSHSGKLQWVNTINAPLLSETYSITTNQNGEVIVASRWVSGNGFDGEQISITKYSASGKLLNNQLIDQAVNVSSYVEGAFTRRRLDLASFVNCVYLTASLSDILNIAHLQFASSGGRDAALVKYNEIGFPQWLTSAQGTGNDEGLRVRSVSNAIFMAGDYCSGQLSFGNHTINNHSGNNDPDFFLTKLIDTTSILCPSVDSFAVSYPAILCHGDSALISIENQYATYTLWFRNGEKLNHDDEKQIFIKTEGIYTVLINQNTRCPVPEITIQVDPIGNQVPATDMVIYPKPLAQIEGLGTVCFGDTLSLSTPADERYRYSWAVPAPLAHSDTTNPTINVVMTAEKQSELFHVQVIDKLSGCFSTDTFAVHINPKPSLSLHWLNYTIWLHSTNTDSVQWYFEGQQLPGFSNAQSIQPQNKGYYYVKGFNKYGCQSISDSILIDKIFGIQNPQSGVSLYPNPVLNFIYINLTTPAEKIELIDITGTLLRTFYNQSVLSVGDLKKGIYILKIYSKQQLNTVKIIKE